MRLTHEKFIYQSLNYFKFKKLAQIKKPEAVEGLGWGSVVGFRLPWGWMMIMHGVWSTTSLVRAIYQWRLGPCSTIIINGIVSKPNPFLLGLMADSTKKCNILGLWKCINMKNPQTNLRFRWNWLQNFTNQKTWMYGTREQDLICSRYTGSQTLWFSRYKVALQRLEEALYQFWISCTGRIKFDIERIRHRKQKPQTGTPLSLSNITLNCCDTLV